VSRRLSITGGDRPIEFGGVDHLTVVVEHDVVRRFPPAFVGL